MTNQAASDHRLQVLGRHLIHTDTALSTEEHPGQPTDTDSTIRHSLNALSVQPTAAGGVQRELQLLLEHDCHAERDDMKRRLDTELFVP